MNPMNFLQLKPAWNRFKANHPKIVPFARAAARDSFLDEGSVIELSITNSSGQKIASNLRVKKDDLEFLRQLRELLEG